MKTIKENKPIMLAMVDGDLYLRKKDVLGLIDEMQKELGIDFSMAVVSVQLDKLKARIEG